MLIIDVLPNGVLVFEGARMVTFSGESYYAVLKVWCGRKILVLDLKTVLGIEILSHLNISQMHKVEFVSKGSLNDTQKESWYQKLSSMSTPSDLNENETFISSVFLCISCVCYGARIKDITDVRGFRSNQLFGYGIVTGF